MKTEQVIHEITPLSSKDFFYIVNRNKTEFTYPLHSHVEFELNFVEKGAGVKRIVGDSVEIIKDYDLVLITGEELEHVWEQNNCTSKEIREITIQFSAEFLNAWIIQKNQFDSISKMLNKAKMGIKFPMEAILKVYNMLDSLAQEQDGFYAVLKFLTILYELSKFTDVKKLASSSFAHTEVSAESRRVQRVYDYVNKHYQEELRLNQLAEIADMSPAAFSRFFKLLTGKNISDYITEIRLGFATRLLVDSAKSISEICYECGFNNISNFNRMFKKKKNCSPKEFRSNYQKTKIII